MLCQTLSRNFSFQKKRKITSGSYLVFSASPQNLHLISEKLLISYKISKTKVSFLTFSFTWSKLTCPLLSSSPSIDFTSPSQLVHTCYFKSQIILLSSESVFYWYLSLFFNYSEILKCWHTIDKVISKVSVIFRVSLSSKRLSLPLCFKLVYPSLKFHIVRSPPLNPLSLNFTFLF